MADCGKCNGHKTIFSSGTEITCPTCEGTGEEPAWLTAARKQGPGIQRDDIDAALGLTHEDLGDINLH